MIGRTRVSARWFPYDQPDIGLAWKALVGAGLVDEFDLFLDRGRIKLQSRRYLFLDGSVDNHESVVGCAKLLLANARILPEIHGERP